MEPRVETVERRSHLQCAICHGALEQEPTVCPVCDTALHPDCADVVGRCPTLGCPVELVAGAGEPSFAEQMEARDGALVRRWSVGGALVGLLAGATVGNPVLGAFQGAVLGPAAGLALRALTTGTPTLGGAPPQRREL